MDKNLPPVSLGIVMDGNRRWAKSKGLMALAGHRAGAEKLKDVVEWSKAAGIKFLTVYAFSTENWNRSLEEVSGIMNLLEEYLDREFGELSKTTRLRFIGERERFSDVIREKVEHLEKVSKDQESFTLSIALSYGGRAEILEAVNKLIEEDREVVTESELSEKLWTAGTPDPDLIIRTGGEKRLSNFLLWQSVYSELFFTPTLWPDFSREEFDAIIAEYAKRERRNGK